MTMHIPSINQVTASPETYSYFQAYIRRESGIVIDDDKHYLLHSRLAPLALAQGFRDLEQLRDALQKPDRKLRQAVVEAMTTNETFFFRDHEQHEVLSARILPDLQVSAAGKKRIRVWSAAASTGQEAYSIAMLTQPLVDDGWAIEIVGTDLSESVLEKARRATYRQMEVNRGLPAQMLIKHFFQQGSEWVVRPETARQVRFQQFDLRNSMASLGLFDLILCRNVLIYFDQSTKADILHRIADCLPLGGYLLLGSAETILGLCDRFERVAYERAVVYRRVR